jgi:hypothetical protein
VNGEFVWRRVVPRELRDGLAVVFEKRSAQASLGHEPAREQCLADGAAMLFAAAINLLHGLAR